jgi:hypothetical protein
LRAVGFTLVAGAALASLMFVRVLLPTTVGTAVFLSAWLLLPYVVLALILALSTKERRAATAAFMVALLVAAGGLLWLTVVIFVRPDPQGGIGVVFTPIYQLVATGVLLPIARWLVNKVSKRPTS